MNEPDTIPVAREDSYLGSATDTYGEELCVFRTPAGNAVILGTEGTALMLSPGEAAKLTGHVDRAVMPGQQNADKNTERATA